MADLVFADVNETLVELSEILRPPERLTVPEAAEAYVQIRTPGGYNGPFKNELVEYLIEPAECLTRRDFEAVILVAPAQSGKTQMLVDNWLGHTIMCDPADFMLVQTSQDTARDFSKRRVDRMLDNSPEMKAKLHPSPDANNTFDKFFRSGMIASLGWPTKNQLAGKAIGKMALTDLDRQPVDVDKEGSPFALSLKRTTTFMSRGMIMAESSPSRPILDPNWKAKNKHEAPPTTGILGLFNTGDMRRAYGQCPHCFEYFMPVADMDAMYIPAGIVDVELAASRAEIACTKCGSTISQDFERAFKKSLKWLKQGQKINSDGVISGEGKKSKRASFWLPGWFVAFQSWAGIVRNYLLAEQQFESTGDETALRNSANLDQGAPYLDKSLKERRNSDVFEERAESLDKRHVPEGVRFLTAQVDVQKYGFVVLVLGWGPNMECWIVDWFKLKISHRRDENDDAYPMDPASYQEDWDLITKKVLMLTYPLSDGSGRRMSLKITGNDSGGANPKKGKPGVTDKAYKYWNKLKVKGLHQRLILLKGGSRKDAPRIKLSFPDSKGRKDRITDAKGEIPVLILNSNQLKDEVNNALNRDKKGAGYVHFPDWLPSDFYEELTAEVRLDKGWDNPSNAPNEPFDLMYYGRALMYHLGVDKFDWSNPESLKPWAKPWDENNMIIDGDESIILNRKSVSQRPRRRRRIRG